jgi:hypothetical protein
MFYRIIKNFLLKKHINKSLTKGLGEVTSEPIKTIGLLVDATHFFEIEKLILEFKKYANGQFKINLLVYRKKVKKDEIIDYPFYTKNDIGISGVISKTEVQNFTAFPFDLLVNFYDETNADLELVSVRSKSKFKVGFTAINNEINHFIVSSYIEKYEEFTQVLFEYLKILKKI